MLNRLALLVCLGLFIGCGDSGNPSRQSITPGRSAGVGIAQDRKLNSEGLAYYRTRNYQVALEKFRAAMALNKKEAEYPNNMGMCHLRLGQPAQAEKLFQKALSLRKIPLYYTNRGQALMQMGKRGDALASFEAAAKLEPKIADPWIFIGTIKYQAGNMAAAKQAWEKAAAIRADAQVITNLGMVALRTKQAKAAEAKFRKAISINPAYALAHFNLGVALQRRKDYEKAEQSYRKAIALNPRSYIPYYNIAIVQTKQNKKQAAKASLEQFLRLIPPNMTGPIAEAKQRLRALNL